MSLSTCDVSIFRQRCIAKTEKYFGFHLANSINSQAINGNPFERFPIDINTQTVTGGNGNRTSRVKSKTLLGYVFLIVPVCGGNISW